MEPASITDNLIHHEERQHGSWMRVFSLIYVAGAGVLMVGSTVCEFSQACTFDPSVSISLFFFATSMVFIGCTCAAVISLALRKNAIPSWAFPLPISYAGGSLPGRSVSRVGFSTAGALAWLAGHGVAQEFVKLLQFPCGSDCITQVVSCCFHVVAVGVFVQGVVTLRPAAAHHLRFTKRLAFCQKRADTIHFLGVTVMQLGSAITGAVLVILLVLGLVCGNTDGTLLPFLLAIIIVPFSAFAVMFLVLKGLRSQHPDGAHGKNVRLAGQVQYSLVALQSALFITAACCIWWAFPSTRPSANIDGWNYVAGLLVAVTAFTAMIVAEVWSVAIEENDYGGIAHGQWVCKECQEPEEDQTDQDNQVDAIFAVFGVHRSIKCDGRGTLRRTSSARTTTTIAGESVWGHRSQQGRQRCNTYS